MGCGTFSCVVELAQGTTHSPAPQGNKNSNSKMMLPKNRVVNLRPGPVGARAQSRFAGRAYKRRLSERYTQRLLAVDFVPNLISMRFFEKQAADHESDAGDDHGVVQAGVDVSIARA